MNIKDIIKNNIVQFRRYRKGILYYGVAVNNSEDIGDITLYEFPVPIEDCGDADFYSQDKAILYMRYIRKALDEGTLTKIVV